MLFTSYTFLIFLPIVFALYWLAGRLKNGLNVQNAVIVIASYVFYGWVNPKLCLLIALTSLTTFAGGLLIKSGYKKVALLGVLLLNLLILGYFKYCNFFVQSIAGAFSAVGFLLDVPTLNIVLPAGISFYTFTALSYTIDVYRGQTQPVPLSGCLSYFAFVSFFPQLLAGPIGRSTRLLPQFQLKTDFDYDGAVAGLRQMLWGFFKKIVVADTFAGFVNNVWPSCTAQSGSSLLIAAIAFSIQIYFDFSGYSDIAIGTAKLFNIKLDKNFDLPYFSRDIAEFWRRWHISLTSWFRDYIYIPLGGSRTTKAKHIRNTIIVFLVSGLWHGANWTFVVWGLYHALLFVPLVLTNRHKRHRGIVAENRLLPSVGDLFRMFFTFTLVTIGWIIFRSDSISQAWNYILGMADIKSMMTLPGCFLQSGLVTVSGLAFIVFVIEWFNRRYTSPLEIVSHWAWPLRYAFYLAVAFCIFWYYKDVNAFIYAQF